MPSWPPIRSAGSSCAVQGPRFCLSQAPQSAWAPVLGSSAQSSSNTSRGAVCCLPGLCFQAAGRTERARVQPGVLPRARSGLGCGGAPQPVRCRSQGHPSPPAPPRTREEEGSGWEEKSGRPQPGGCVKGPSHPHSPRPESRREGEGALVPLQVGMETALPPPPLACISALWVLVPQPAPPRWEASVPRRRKNKRGLWKPGLPPVS